MSSAFTLPLLLLGCDLLSSIGTLVELASQTKPTLTSPDPGCEPVFSGDWEEKHIPGPTGGHHGFYRLCGGSSYGIAAALRSICPARLFKIKMCRTIT